MDKVAWCGKNSIDTIAITHAARRAGLIAVPLNYRLTVDELAYLVANSDARALWIDAEMASTFVEVAARSAEVAARDAEVGGASSGRRMGVAGTGTPWLLQASVRDAVACSNHRSSRGIPT